MFLGTYKANENKQLCSHVPPNGEYLIHCLLSVQRNQQMHLHLYNLPSERTYTRRAILHNFVDRKFLEMYRDRKQISGCLLMSLRNRDFSRQAVVESPLQSFMC